MSAPFAHAAAFWGQLPRATGLKQRPRIDAALADALQRARDASPGVTVDLTRFVAHWAHHLAGAANPEEAFDAMHVEDLYFAFACAERDVAALGRFRGTLFAAVAGVISGVDASYAFVEEATQQLLERLLVSAEGQPPRILGFAGRTSLESWLRAVALRTALNLRRTQNRVREVPVGEALLEAPGPARDPQLEHLRARYGSEISGALQKAISQLTAQERNVLKLHFVDGMSLNQIGAVYQANKSTVSRWLARARGNVLDGACRDLEGRLGIPKSEFRSMIRQLKSQVELSLKTVLGPPP